MHTIYYVEDKSIECSFCFRALDSASAKDVREIYRSEQHKVLAKSSHLFDNWILCCCVICIQTVWN